MINALWIILGAILLIFGIRGYRKGLMKQSVEIIFFIIAFGLVGKLTPYVRTFLEEKTSINSLLGDLLRKVMPIEVHIQGNVVDAKVMGILGGSKVILEEYADQSLDGVLNYIYELLTKQLLGALVFLLTLLLVLFLFKALILGVDVMEKLPVVHQFNRLGGTLVGLAFGLMVCLIVLLVLSIFQGSDWGQYLLKAVEETYFLERIYQGLLMFLTS